MHREVDIQFARKNEKDYDKWEDRSRPDEDEDTKKNEERVKDGKGDDFGDLDGLIETFKKRHFGFFYTTCESLYMRIDEVQCNCKSKKIWPNIKHTKSIP